jgi:hypothetical protein
MAIKNLKNTRDLALKICKFTFWLYIDSQPTPKKKKKQKKTWTTLPPPTPQMIFSLAKFRYFQQRN